MARSAAIPLAVSRASLNCTGAPREGAKVEVAFKGAREAKAAARSLNRKLMSLSHCQELAVNLLT